MPKKQKSGLYRSKVTIGHEPDGKPVVKYISGKTKAELEKEKQKVIAYYIDGSEADKDKLFGEFVVDWFRIKRAPRLKPVSLQNYRTLINTHILPTFAERRLRALRVNDLQSWMNSFAGCSESKIDKLYMMMRAIIRDAYAEGLLARDIAAGLFKPLPAKTDPRRDLTPEETTAVLKIIDEHPDGALLAVLYYLGVRRGEALGLQWGDIDFEAHLVHIQRDIVYVRGKTTIGDLKTNAADRYVLLPSPLSEILRPKCGPSGAWVFQSDRGGNPLCQTTYKRTWLSLMEHGGLVEEKEPTEAVKKKSPKRVESFDLLSPTITAHYLRHNYITKLFYAGIDAVIAMWMVGHESYETTVDVYTHLRKARFKEPPTDMEWVYALKKEANKIQRPDQIHEKQASTEEQIKK